MEERRVEVISLDDFEDERGKLVVAERLPFEIRRAFWIYGRHLIPRGGHAHKKCHQFLVPMVGIVTVVINGISTFMLSSKQNGIYIPPGNRIDMHFDPGAILLVLASEEYDPDDYI